MADEERRDRSESPEFEFTDDKGRPLVAKSGVVYKFRPGQAVYLQVPGASQLEGPYKIESSRGPGMYTLCHSNGQTARGGTEINEANLTAA
ncbi:hypothetical protein F5Y12DRAFT_710646 [Xylaria sp. FL1777]|nr:hypothetical protein F5Y12DRAFT_710646 [Xylaria sp. FL1777]